MINLITNVNTGIVGDGLLLPALCAWGSRRGALCPVRPFPLAQLSAPVSCPDSHQFGLSSLMAVNEQRQQDQRNWWKLLLFSHLFVLFFVPAVLGGAQLDGLHMTGAVCWWGGSTQQWHTITPLPPTSLSASGHRCLYGKALLPASVTSLTSCAGAAQRRVAMN